MNKQIKAAGATLAIAALLSLAGCGTSTVSKNISDDGRAGEVVFPDIGKDAWLKEGTFPNVDNLRRIGPGVTKDQLYDLVGRPHFRESLFGVREWDYIFNFRVPGGVKTCQYKVIYDTALRAQSFHWLPADCAELLKVASPSVERIAEKAPVPQRVELSADALFAFGRSGPADLLPQGRRELDALAAGLRGARETSRLRITGHTDRLGSTSFNEQLSLARATTVRDHLVQAGVPARGMQVEGKGETEPKVQCEQKKREELIACLAPNRRVEIEVDAER
ncbi:OmpA family protein [Variovorax paradoxus]|nr:OmpA family protein [Variovorax paradoxus]MBT2299600.1 OmpA family protein [Variovorax paradoxus]